MAGGLGLAFRGTRIAMLDRRGKIVVRLTVVYIPDQLVCARGSLYSFALETLFSAIQLKDIRASFLVVATRNMSINNVEQKIRFLID